MIILSIHHLNSMVAHTFEASEMQSSMEEHELMGEELSVADAVRRLRMMGEIEADYAPAAPALKPAPVRKASFFCHSKTCAALRMRRRRAGRST